MALRLEAFDVQTAFFSVEGCDGYGFNGVIQVNERLVVRDDEGKPIFIDEDDPDGLWNAIQKVSISNTHSDGTCYRDMFKQDPYVTEEEVSWEHVHFPKEHEYLREVVHSSSLWIDDHSIPGPSTWNCVAKDVFGVEILFPEKDGDISLGEESNKWLFFPSSIFCQ